MAEGESNLSVQLFVELKGKFPQVPELQLQNTIKQFSNNRDKCLEALTKEFSNMSSPSQPNNNHVSNSRKNYNFDCSTFSSNEKPWTHYRRAEVKPNANPDFEPFINHCSDSSTIPNIKCQSSPPIRQIAVHHITTSKPDSPNTHVICKSPSNSSSSSPINGNQWNWFPHHQQHQKSHEVLITSSPAPSSSSSTQRYAKAQLFIDPPNWNVTNLQTVINPSAPGSACVISSNPRLQPSQLITIHSPEPGSQSGAGLYSPQPGYVAHGSSELFTAIGHTPSPSPWIPDINPVFSTPQLIPVKVQPTTSSPSTPHHISSTTYHTMPQSQQSMGSSTTSTIIHYPALRVNNSPGQQGNSTASESMKNRTPNHMPILQPVSPSDNVHMARPRNGSLQDDKDYTNALITHQRLRYDKLNEDYKLLVGHCKELEEEIDNLTRDKKECYSKGSFLTESEVLKLRNSTESLRNEIFSLAKELDAHNNGLTPIGVLDPLEQQHFYKNMNTGQSGSIFATPQSQNSWSNPPPRPPRYVPESHPVPPPITDIELSEESWDCSECTYRNHHAMDKCEICEIPRRKGRVKQHHCNTSLCYCHDR